MVCVYVVFYVCYGCFMGVYKVHSVCYINHAVCDVVFYVCFMRCTVFSMLYGVFVCLLCV